MSQDKVNKYKEYKKNRKEIIAQQKKKKQMERILGYSVLGIFGASLVGALGVTAWNEYQVYLDTRPNYVQSSYILSDMNSILEEETEESTEESTDKDDKEETSKNED